MVRTIKNKLYFLVAGYFWFFARIRLARWQPRIVVITGSNGKTSTLHLVEAQLGSAAKYSHHANSSFGIPFDILGLHRTTYDLSEWISLFAFAPLRAWKAPYTEKIYVVEADCDRPHEGQFLSALLRPEVTIWLSSARTHSQNFEKAVAGDARTVEERIAHEFGYFAASTVKRLIVNADNPLIAHEAQRSTAQVHAIKERGYLEYYTVTDTGTTFTLNGITYELPYLLPRETMYSVAAALTLSEYFGMHPNDFSTLVMPPGRSSVFPGIKNTILIDSTYNANVNSIDAIVRMVKQLPSKTTWAVIGDLTEQGRYEKEEHEKLAHLLLTCNFQKIILVGPRLERFTLPLLRAAKRDNVIAFLAPSDALDHVRRTISGGEMILFKGARFLEGVVEHLLARKEDADKLCRRESVWQRRRAQWGL